MPKLYGAINQFFCNLRYNWDLKPTSIFDWQGQNLHDFKNASILSRVGVSMFSVWFYSFINCLLSTEMLLRLRGGNAFQILRFYNLRPFLLPLHSQKTSSVDNQRSANNIYDETVSISRRLLPFLPRYLNVTTFTK